MESQTGNNSIDKVIERALKVEMSMTLDSMASENLARMVFGKVTTTAAGTVTNESHQAIPGKYLTLKNINVTTLTSITNVGGTVTYAAGAGYEVTDLPSGLIKILGGAISNTEIRANYSYGASEAVAAFAAPNTEYWLRFNGLNSAEEDSPVIIDCFKVRFAPASDIPVINNDGFAEYKQSGTCLFDATQSATGKLGRYFSVQQLVAS
jgi:hypothetical protein